MITFPALQFGKSYFLNTFDDGNDGDGGTATPPATTVTPPPAQSFTQEQVNSMIAAERRKIETAAKQQNAETLNQLQLLQTKASLTEEERTSLESQISTLNTQVHTAEELAAQRQKKLETQFAEERENLSQQRDQWKGRFTEATISRGIVDEAVKNDAFNPEQIVAIIRPQTRLVETTDEEGNVTGYVPKVTTRSVNKKGETVELELTIGQAIEQMKENQSFYNLFKGKSLDSLGSNNNGTGSKADPGSMSPEQYKKWRAEQKKAGNL